MEKLTFTPEFAPGVGTGKLQELNKSEMVKVSGGALPWGAIVSAAGLIGAASIWVFERGEELGRSLAKL